MQLVWDPNLTRTDFFDFGRGWSFGRYFVDVQGGARLYFPELGAFYVLNDTVPTGLEGYPYDDVRVEQLGAGHQVPARGEIPAREYRFTLFHRATNVTHYFSSAGDLIASIDQTTGARSDLVWGDPNWPGHRLDRLVEANGDETRLTYFPDANEREIELPGGGTAHREYISNSYQWNFAPGGGRTFFEGIDPWFVGVRTPNFNGGVDPLELQFRWDVERPGRVLEVLERRDGGGWQTIYVSPRRAASQANASFPFVPARDLLNLTPR